MPGTTIWRSKEAFARVLRRTGLLDGLLDAQRNRPIVLRYHRVYPDDATPFYEMGVPRSLFEAQLDVIQRQFNVVRLVDLYDGLFGAGPLPELAVAITFDDGYRDNRTQALPALAARGLPATLFVSIGHVDGGPAFWWDALAATIERATVDEVEADLAGRVTRHSLRGRDDRRCFYELVVRSVKAMPDERSRRVLAELSKALNSHDGNNGDGDGDDTEPRLTWDDIEVMAASGFDVGSHGIDHALLARLTPEAAEHQIRGSKERLEQRLGRPVELFAYPNGKPEDVTREVIDLVRQSGYRGAVSTAEGRCSVGSDPFFLERIGATRGMCSLPDGRFSEALFVTELSDFYNRTLRRARTQRAS